jgi:multidrug efflux pump subunit AcrA (membrane-fusion protein)
MKIYKKFILFFLIFILGVFFFLRFVSLGSNRKKASFASAQRKETVTVKAISVQRGDFNLNFFYVGSLKAKDEVNVFSKAGGKLAEYSVNEGDRVEKGQAIAFIDRDQTGLKYELARVDSPIAGVVGRTFLDKGADIAAGEGSLRDTSLAVILNMDEMTVRLNIPENEVPYFKKGLAAKIQVDAYPKESFAGVISKVSEVVDSATRTLPIEISIPNADHRLKSGMFCRVSILVSQLKDRISLPQDALVQELGQDYIFIVEDHTALKKKVILGVKEDGRVEVADGLNQGQKVIIFGQQGLKDGSSVEIIEE